MEDKQKEMRTESAAIILFTMLSSTTALAAALLPFFVQH